MMTHEWHSYAPHHFQCSVCKGIANNASPDGHWSFGTNVKPKECPGPQRTAEARSWPTAKPAWPVAKPAAAITIDSDVKPPSTWPTAPKPATAWPTKQTGWPNATK